MGARAGAAEEEGWAPEATEAGREAQGRAQAQAQADAPTDRAEEAEGPRACGEGRNLEEEVDGQGARQGAGEGGGGPQEGCREESGRCRGEEDNAGGSRV